MRLPVAPLLPALRRVQQAPTRAERQDAAWAFYAIATPLLTHRCAAVIQRYAPLHWQAPEDLAADTLLSVVAVPERTRACRATTPEGVLAWLRGAAYRGLRSTPEARACRALELRVVPLTDGMAEHLPMPAVARSTPSMPTFRRAYDDAVRRLRPLDQRVWITHVEQEIPAAEVAQDLGQTAHAVRGRVQRVAAILRQQLAAYAPPERVASRRRHAPEQRERAAR